MKLQQRWAVAVLAAMVIVVSNAGAEILPGKASLGGMVGVPLIMGDDDLKEGASPRLIGEANFQYVFTPSWRLSASFGYGWSGYKDGTPTPYPVRDPDTGDSVNVRDDMLSKFVPIDVTLIRSLKEQGKGWSPFVGAGVGMTRVEIVNKRIKIKDPATFDALASWSPNAHGLVGVEYVLPSNTNVSFDWSARWTQLLKDDPESFPSGFTGKHSFLSLTFGVNVYFWPIGYKPVETAKTPAPDSLLTPPSSTPAPESAPPPPAPEPPAAPDTSLTPPTPKSAPQAHASLVAPAKPAPTGTPTTAPVTPTIVIDDGQDDAVECPATDLGPMLGLPPRPHPAEEPREP